MTYNCTYMYKEELLHILIYLPGSFNPSHAWLLGNFP